MDLAPFGGVVGQKAYVLLNGQRVADLVIDTRRRQRIELPAAFQRAGEQPGTAQ